MKNYLNRGSLSGYGTYAAIIATVAGIWGAFLLDAPFLGEEPLGLGAAVIASLMAVVAWRQRMGTAKAERAANAIADEAVTLMPPGDPRQGWSGSGLIFLALILPLASMGCAARLAEENALMPSLAMAAPGVRSDCYRGIGDAVADGDLLEAAANEIQIRGAGLWYAIEQRVRESIVERIFIWLELRPFGDRGIQDMIDDGEIGPNGAASRTERLDLFGEALDELAD